MRRSGRAAVLAMGLVVVGAATGVGAMHTL
jgi:hypothetical protein